jgi:hypothetical protein
MGKMEVEPQLQVIKERCDKGLSQGQGPPTFLFA